MQCLWPSWWYLCGSTEDNGILIKTHWAPQAPWASDSCSSKRNYVLYVLEYSPNSPLGKQSWTRESVDQWWMDPLSGILWASLHCSQACDCPGKHRRVLQILYMGNWASWHNETNCHGLSLCSGLVSEKWTWSLLVLLVRDPVLSQWAVS